MNSINALGLRMAGLTSVILIVLAGVLWGGRVLLKNTGTESQPVAQAPTDTERTDADGDGLPDQFEAVYRTDKLKADTDGDGIGDYAEIAQGKDPAVAGAQDVAKPVTGSAVAPQGTFTERYLASLPVGATREQVLDQAKLEAFVNLNKGTLLPPRPASAIKTTEASGKEAVSTYLNAISTVHNKALAAVNNEDIQAAFTQRLQEQPQALSDIISKLEKNLQILQQVAAPQEVVELHTTLLSASEALLGNTRLLANTENDFVGSLVGSKNIEDLGPVFKQIADSVKALETKYGLE